MEGSHIDLTYDLVLAAARGDGILSRSQTQRQVDKAAWKVIEEWKKIGLMGSKSDGIERVIEVIDGEPNTLKIDWRASKDEKTR